MFDKIKVSVVIQIWNTEHSEDMFDYCKKQIQAHTDKGYLWKTDYPKSKKGDNYE